MRSLIYLRRAESLSAQVAQGKVLNASPGKAKLRLWLPVWLLAAVLVSLADANSITYSYDSAGRLTKVDYGNGTGITYAYDNAGNLLNRSAFSFCNLKRTGSTTVSDVQTIINEALGTAPAVDDLNHDGVVNVADVQILINAALGLGCAAQ